MDRTTGDQHVANMFDEGDPGEPRLPTQIDATWLNDVQEEIVSIIEEAGLTPTEGAQQLLAALQGGALKADELILGATATTTDAFRIYMGDPAGPDRVLVYVIGSAVWVTWNVVYQNSDQTWDRVAAGHAYAFVFGDVNGSAQAKFYFYSSTDADGWSTAAWQTANGLAGAQSQGAALFRGDKLEPTISGGGWTEANNVYLYKTPFGRVEIQGHLTDASGAGFSTVFCTLPVAYRPATPKIILIGSSVLNNTGLLTIATNGEVQIQHAGVAATYYLDGCGWDE